MRRERDYAIFQVVEHDDRGRVEYAEALGLMRASSQGQALVRYAKGDPPREGEERAALSMSRCDDVFSWGEALEAEASFPVDGRMSLDEVRATYPQ